MMLKKVGRGKPQEYEIRDKNGFLLGVVQLVSIEREGASTYCGLHIAHTERINVKVDRVDDPRDWFKEEVRG